MLAAGETDQSEMFSALEVNPSTQRRRLIALCQTLRGRKGAQGPFLRLDKIQPLILLSLSS